jgi:branched-chain amino acid transport system ATP-binding protein
MALLEASNITVKFGGITAVNDASLSADPGSITGLIGPNGAGKTTLFNVITGLQAPTAGRIRFRAQNITQASVNHRAKMGMARTFQRLEAFGSLTVRENVQVAREIHAGARTWFRRRKDPTVDELIRTVGLERYVDHRADSVPTGVARLLEMARALAIEPKLLLLDEPSSGLDEAETENFGRLLQRLAADGCSILMVEHDMELVMSVCDLIHVLEFGKVIATGTPAEIRANRTVQAAYLGFSDDGDDALPVPDEVAAEATAILGAHGAHSPAETTLTMPAVEAER